MRPGERIQDALQSFDARGEFAATSRFNYKLVTDVLATCLPQDAADEYHFPLQQERREHFLQNACLQGVAQLLQVHVVVPDVLVQGEHELLVVFVAAEQGRAV